MFKKNSTVRLIFAPTGSSSRRRGVFFWPILLVYLAILPGCQTIPTLPPVNLSQPGWTIRQGQAVWRSKKAAPEIAGELLVAVNPDGRSFVQFTKTPFPMVIAQTTSNSWQIQDVRKNRVYSFRGHPPAGLLWLQLPRCFDNSPPLKKWKWEHLENGGFRFQNPSTGELLEGYLNP
jgi:hypothetical protein